MPPILDLQDNRLMAVNPPFPLKDVLKGLTADARWDAERRAWTYAPHPLTAVLLHEVLPGVAATAEFRALLETGLAEEAALCEPLPEPGEIHAAKLKPWRHQAQAYEWAEGKGSCILAMDMGTGKSAIVVWAVIANDMRRVLITCPVSVLNVWPREFERHANGRARIVTLGPKLSVQEKKDVAANEMSRDWGMPLVIIINHESLWRAPFGEWAASRSWDMVVVDEIHRAKSAGGKFSRYLARLRPMAQRRVGLTGTLLPHSMMDAYAQCRAIDPNVFGNSFTRFRARYAVMGGYGGYEVVGFRNTTEFGRQLASIALQIKAEDVLDLPEVQHITIEFDLNPKEQKLYNQMERDLMAEVESGVVTASNALVKLLRLQQITSGYLKTDNDEIVQVGTSKQQVFADLLEDFGRREPVVTFSRFHSDLNATRNVCDQQGRVYGELSGRDKGGLNDKAEMSDDVDVLGAQIQAGGVGVDLTRAHYCIYYSVGYNLGDYLQSLARTHRPGQTERVTYYHLVARGTIDETVSRALQAKQDAVESVLQHLGRRMG